MKLGPPEPDNESFASKTNLSYCMPSNS